MILIILTVVVIASLIAVLATYLSVIGVLLNRIADNLDDCLGNVKIIMGQAEVVLPGVGRINQTGDVVAGALPLLVEAAEGATTKLVPPQEVAQDSVPQGGFCRCGLPRCMTPISNRYHLISASRSRDPPHHEDGAANLR